MENKLLEFSLVKPYSGDWEALYLNGRLIAEGHRLCTDDVLDAIADEVPNTFELIGVSDEVAERGMPETLDELTQ